MIPVLNGWKKIFDVKILTHGWRYFVNLLLAFAWKIFQHNAVHEGFYFKHLQTMACWTDTYIYIITSPILHPSFPFPNPTPPPFLKQRHWWWTWNERHIQSTFATFVQQGVVHHRGFGGSNVALQNFVPPKRPQDRNPWDDSTHQCPPGMCFLFAEKVPRWKTNKIPGVYILRKMLPESVDDAARRYSDLIWHGDMHYQQLCFDRSVDLIRQHARHNDHRNEQN